MTGLHGGAVYHHPAPWDRPLEPIALPDMLWRTEAAKPTAVALDFFGKRTTYAKLAAQVRRAAGGFQALGLGRGSKVGLFLPNCPHYPIAYYGALAAGAVVVNFSPLYSAEELEWQARDAGVETMVCLDAAQLYPVINAVLATGALKRLIVGNVPQALPWAKRNLYNLLKRSERAPVERDEQHLPFERLLRLGSFDPVEIDPQSVALIQYSGGTTGRPKGALLSHANLTSNAQQVAAIEPRPGEPHRLLAALPFFHVFANTGLLNNAVLRGHELVILPKFTAALALSAIERRRVTAMPGVPAMFQAMMDHPRFPRTDFSSLRVCVAGGAALPTEMQQRFEAAVGCRVAEGYGLSETSGVATANPYEGERRIGTVGQAIPGTEIVIVDRDDPTRPAAPGEAGEVTIGGPQVMLGYLHGNGRDDPSAFVNGRLRTGDIGCLDADGFLTIVDRIKDMIIVGGFKVFPSRIEDVAYTHPAVAEALVIPVPDERVGERPKLYVSLRPGATATEAELLALVNAHVGKHERPVAVVIAPALPKTRIGKLDRRALIAQDRGQAA